MENTKLQLTVQEALEQGFTHFVYDEDGFQRIQDIIIDEIDFSRDNISLVQKESYHPSGLDSEQIAEMLGEAILLNHQDDTGDDTEDVYDAIMEIDFSDVSKKIDEALSHLNYYRSAGIKLIPNH